MLKAKFHRQNYEDAVKMVTFSEAQKFSVWAGVWTQIK